MRARPDKASLVLTPLQEEFLRAIGRSEVGDYFYLTGGTALSAFFLQHRLSEDLDFFTADSAAVTVVRGRLAEIAAGIGAVVEYRRAYRTFLDCVVTGQSGETVRVDFAEDPVMRLGPVRREERYGILVDNALDIACNKLSALFDRHEPKDFVDIFFIDKELYPFPEILENARRKHVGMDNFWLAQSLRRIEAVSILPRMIKDLRLDEMRDFFLGWAEKLVDDIRG